MPTDPGHVHSFGPRGRASCACGVHPEDVAAHRVVKCEACRADLYRTDGCSIRSVTPDSMTITPLVLEVRDVRHVFCSRACGARWLLTVTDREVIGGYPLF